MSITTLLSPITYPAAPPKRNVELIRNAKALGTFIGHTPLQRIDSLSRPGVNVYAKYEWCQLSGSVKARAAYAMVLESLQQGILTPDKTILDATSGNTGIALAAVGARLGLPVTLCLPENATAKRKHMLRALGAEIIYTSPLEGTDGAREIARQIAATEPDRFVHLDQYSNVANREAHVRGTALEILAKVRPSHFIAGLGTTGTFNGTGSGLRAAVPDVRLVALQPDAPMHGLEGWKHLETAEVPGIHDASLADETRVVSTLDALEMLRRLAREEGLLLSPSSAANALGAARLADELHAQGLTGTVVTIFPDDMTKYDEVFDQF